jgi:hypothetical protein
MDLREEVFYLHKISENGINLKHTNVTEGGNIQIDVLSKSEDIVLLTVFFPEFSIFPNSISNDDTKRYFNFVVDKYDTIVANVSDHNVEKYFNTIDTISTVRGHASIAEYIEYTRNAINSSLKTSKEVVEESVRKALDEALISISSIILNSGDPIGCLKYITNKSS